MPPSPLFLATCEVIVDGEWNINDLSDPAFVLVKTTSPGVYRETFLIKSTGLQSFKNDNQSMSFEGPNSLAPKAFLISKGIDPKDYKMAVVTVEGKPIAGMPDPQAGSNTRFQVRNNGATVVGQLFRSDNAGSWQDTWSLSTNFVWGNATTDVRPQPNLGLPGNPAAWSTQAKAAAPGGQYIQYSYTFGPVT